MDSRVRASPEQLSTLLEYMETHGDLARPLAGAQGRIRSDQKWSELTNILNALGGGVNKTTEKWKKVWADWKSKTKKKGLAVRQHCRGTGGGPASRQTLSAIEERLLAVMGALQVEGQASVEELGFNRSQSPARDDSLTVDDTEYLEITYTDETSHLPSAPSPQPSTSQPFNSWLLPSTSPSQIQTPPPRPVIRVPYSSRGRQPAAPSPAAPPSPPARAAPAPPAPAAPTTPRRRRPPAPRASATPPPARRRPRVRSPATPQSAGSPGRPRLRARRRRQAPTPFERAASEFTAVELRRLEIEETRTRLQHERDMRALEVEHDRNEVFRALVNVAQAWLDYHRRRDNT